MGFNNEIVLKCEVLLVSVCTEIKLSKDGSASKSQCYVFIKWLFSYVNQNVFYVLCIRIVCIQNYISYCLLYNVIKKLTPIMFMKFKNDECFQNYFRNVKKLKYIIKHWNISVTCSKLV